MLYEIYLNKIRKRARILSKIVRMLPVIITVMVMILAAIVALLAYRGTVTEFTCTQEVEYGRQPTVYGKAFWSEVSFEYSTDGGGSWTSEAPYMPGEYQVRAAGETIFGKPRYSDPQSWVIVPKSVSVGVSEMQLLYGDSPSVQVQLVYGDELVCNGYVYALLDSTNALPTGVAAMYSVVPDSAQIRIYDTNGNDVTHAYAMQPVLSELAILQREITVTVQSASHEYDAFPFSFDGYELSDGTLLEGEVLIATFSTELTDVGSVENPPELKVLSPNGDDRTVFYRMSVVPGTLTVEKRPLIIQAGSGIYEYCAQEITQGDFTLDPTTSLAEGHQLFLQSGTIAKDVGEYQNNLIFAVLDAQEADKTENYSIFLEPGSISVTHKELSILTEGNEWEYDGNDHTMTDCTVEGLIEGHIIDITTTTIRNVGTLANDVVEYVITDVEGADVTHNYLVQMQTGTLSITPRPLTLRTGSYTWTYDGEEHQYANYEIEGVLSTHSVYVSQASQIRNVGEATNAISIQLFSTEPSSGAYADVTANYDITYIYGTLEIVKRPITIISSDMTWVYDAQTHDEQTYTVSSYYKVANSDELTLLDWAEVTDASLVQNTFAFTIRSKTCTAEQSDPTRTVGEHLDDSCCDVAQNYDVTVLYGQLEILPRPISIKPVDREKVYDDVALMANEYELMPQSEYDLVQGHVLDVTYGGSIVDVGGAISYVEKYCVLDASGADVTHNYSVTGYEGWLSVLIRQITVYTESATKYYDRTPLICTDFGIYEDQLYPLVQGHTMYLDFTGSQTEFGTSDNTIDPENTRIYSDVRDVTHNYEILAYEIGTLTVLPNAVLTVSSQSDWKFYDGTPLTNDGYSVEISEGAIRTDLGHSLVVEVYGSITEVGYVENAMRVQLLDAQLQDVSDYYMLSTTEGTLRVMAPEETGMVFGQVKTTQGGSIYLKQYAMGDYTGQGWLPAPEYGNTLPGGLSYDYLTSIALSNSGYLIMAAELKDLILYMLPYYMWTGGDYEMQSSDTVYSGMMQSFTVPYYFVPNLKSTYTAVQGNLGEYAAYEEQYRQFVYQNYLTLDEESRAFMENLIAEQGFDASDPTVIAEVATYIQYAAVYDDKNYDRAMELEPNVAIAFLSQYKRGVCRHYAASAVLLYRALGIPARYVEGFMLMTQAGQYVDITEPRHAWVEVYIDGLGWVQVEVTGFRDDQKQEIIVKPEYQWKYYDGQPLEAKNMLEQNDSLYFLLEEGLTYEVVVSGSITEVGVGVSTVSKFVIYDAKGNDVTHHFKITMQEGELEVVATERELIRVYLYALQKYYDGTPLRFEDEDYEIIEIPDGLDLVLSLHIEMTEVGKLSLSAINLELDKYATYKVYRDGRDVTAQYQLVFDEFVPSATYVPIKVDERMITVTSASRTKQDDGTPLVDNTVILSSGELVEGHYIQATVSGRLDEPGEAANTIDEVRVFDANGIEVTHFYDIDMVAGTLIILAPDE